MNEADRTSSPDAKDPATTGPVTPRLGELLLRSGQIDRTTLRSALEKQRTTRRHLGEILIDSGVPLAAITSALIRQVRLQASGGRVGALVVELGLATPKQVGQALFRQVQERKPLGTVLVEIGALTPKQLEQVLAIQRLRDEEDAAFRAESELDAIRSATDRPDR